MRSLISLAILLLATPALANDSTFGGTGSDLVPLQEKRVRMAAEDIVLELKPDKKKTLRWFADATYTFENPTAQDLTLTVGFPEQFCPEEGDCNSPHSKHTFFDMKTTIDGKPVKMRVGKVSAQDKTWAPELGRVHLFDLTIKANQTVKVNHKYHFNISAGSTEESWLYYITKTGALWSGPIGHARFTIRMPERPWGLAYPKTYNLISYTTKMQGKSSAITELIFEMKDWTPTQDLMLHFDGAMSHHDTHVTCPLVHPFSFEDSLDVPTLEFARKYFDKFDDKTLRICRNWPYARYGYTFKDDSLQKFFYRGPRAVQNQYLDDPKDTKSPRDYIRLNYQPNPHFSDAMLTRDELNYIRLVKLLEDARKKK
jgi:hypothetical protein